MRGLTRAAAATALVASMVLTPMAAGASTAEPARSPSTAQLAVGSGGLSETGNAAIDDIRTCLASGDVLNIYYLIDNSQSLKVEDDGVTPGTDPDVVRADILGNSLQQLGALDDRVTVNWAAGFFSTEFAPALSWQPWTDASNSKLADTIRAKQPGGYTNWLGGLRGAQAQLAKQQQSAPGCQAIVWLTDGMMDLPNDSDEGPALEELCGTGAGNYGLLNAMRQSGVVVLGVLLADKTVSEQAKILGPLVEGDVDGQKCGQNPIPANYVHGALIEASDPAALAVVFLELATRIGGGYPAPLNADGTFAVDPGVARFQIVIGSGKWSLAAPPGSGLAPMTANAVWPDAKVTKSGDATLVEVPITDAPLRGTWKLDAANVTNVFLFSDLRIVFDDENQIELGTDGTASSSIGAMVQTDDGAGADLGVYGKAEFHAWIVPADGSAPMQLEGATVDRSSGRVNIPLPTDIDSAQLLLTASIDPLVTAPNGLQLAPVTTQQQVHAVLPDSFPRTDSESIPVQLGELIGRDGVAAGEFKVLPAPDGTVGRVCVAPDVTVGSDAADRAESWVWEIGKKQLDADGCVEVPAGSEPVSISISASNDVPADSAVRASASVTFVSAEGKSITQQVPIEFASTRPVNAAAIGLIALVLLVLGVLLPLLILWVINWLTTTLSIARNTQRGVLPITIDGAGVHPTGALDEAHLGGNVFQNRPPIERERAIHDPELGDIRARVPWWPVNDTWFEVVPPTGAAIVVARTSSRAGALGSRAAIDDRAVRFAHLPFDSFSAIVVSEAELRRTRSGDTVAARAVLYHRPEPGVPDQYTRRIGELRAESELLKKVDRLREALLRAGASAAVARAGKGQGQAQGQTHAAAQTQGNGAATPPPPPGRAGASTASSASPPPPTRTAGHPPATGGTAPPAQGSAPPPPPRGTPPPPPPRGR